MKQEIIYGRANSGILDYTAIKAILDSMHCFSVFTFTGPLGAGKTTLVQSVLKACGVKEVIASPTFTYVNIYTNAQGQTFYHFDLYRITTVEEFLSLGFDEYLYQANSWAFIEWPEVIKSLLTHDVCHVDIDYYDGLAKRKLIMQAE